MDPFRQRKFSILKEIESAEADKSKKGGLDEPILTLISRINLHSSFVTTSSCSGRVSLFLETTKQQREISQKKGGRWLFVSHEKTDKSIIISSVHNNYGANDGQLVFRFEPFILACECKTADSAQAIVSCAIRSGFRESGITILGKRNIIAIRCSIRMEVPVADNGQLLISDEYLGYLVEQANLKFDANKTRIDRFTESFVQEFGFNDELCGARIDKAIAMPRESKPAGEKREQCSSFNVSNRTTSLEERQVSILQKIQLLETRISTLSLPLSTQSGIDKLKGAAGNTESKKSLLNWSIGWDATTKSQIRNGGRSNETQEKIKVTHSISLSNDCWPLEGHEASNPAFLDATCDQITFSGIPEDALMRWSHQSVVLTAGNKSEPLVLLFGGYGGPGSNSRRNNIILLNPANQSAWVLAAKGTYPKPRVGHTCTSLETPNGQKVFVIGGREGPDSVLGDTHFLDLGTEEWTAVRQGGDFVPRFRHGAAAVGDKIYVFGGLAGPHQPMGSLQILDTASGMWSVVLEGSGKVPSERHSHSMASSSGKVFLFGGRNNKSRILPPLLHCLDPVSLEWSTVELTAGLPRQQALLEGSGRFSHSLIEAGNGRLFVFGGCPVAERRMLQSFVVLLSEPDCSRGSVLEVRVDLPPGTLPVRHTASFVGGKVMVIGGGAFCFAFGSVFSKPFLIGFPHATHGKETLVLVREPAAQTTGQLSRSGSLCVVSRTAAKACKDFLKSNLLLEQARHVLSLNGGAEIGFPLSEVYDPNSPSVALSLDEFGARVLRSDQQESSPLKNVQLSPYKRMRASVGLLLKKQQLSGKLLEELPQKWERLGDMAILPACSLDSASWQSLGDSLWATIAESLGVSRLARQAPIAPNGTRDSRLTLLLGDSAWVEHRENGITCCLDARKCMFSSGNVSEKLRVSKFVCTGETVVDLFAGIGYYTLPYLMKCGAAQVIACEWNPNAIAALRHNLRVNKVEDKCVVLEGDNRIVCPQRVADRVNLGLLPSSEDSWQTAIGALKEQGGFLHVHGNYLDAEANIWAGYVAERLAAMAAESGLSWKVEIVHLEKVKWYSPHVRHLVVDIKCSPANPP